MSPLRSVGARLSLALMLVVAVALGVAWAIVVPPLEHNLTQSKLDQLTRRAHVWIDRFPAFYVPDNLAYVQDYTVQAAFDTNARVVVFLPFTSNPDEGLQVVADSQTAEPSEDVLRDPVALRAVETSAPTDDVVIRDDQRYVEVALPILSRPGAVLFSSPLEDTLASVDQVKQRLLIAGAVALALAVLLGYGGSSMFARRIRRLERAADRIAGGHLDEPVVVEGRDELGQLSEAFERMRRRLARLDHARREFIANASHELRTPIFSLGGFLELLANEELDEATRREFLATMQGQIARLEKLATDLLDLTRLDAGQLRLERERLDLGRVAEELAEEFAAVALAAGHELEATVDGAPDALADETRVLQVGRALVENALRHTPPGTRVQVRAEGDGGSAALTVEDDGPGISSEHAGPVFERFYRIEGAASGSGLGLAIARELATAMGGTVVLESEPGRTVFRLLLPVAAPAEVRAAEPAVS